VETRLLDAPSPKRRLRRVLRERGHVPSWYVLLALGQVLEELNALKLLIEERVHERYRHRIPAHGKRTFLDCTRKSMRPLMDQAWHTVGYGRTA